MTDERLMRMRKAATRPRRTVAVHLDGEVREQIEAVEVELDRLDAPTDDQRQNSRSTAAKRRDLEGELERLHEAATDMTLFAVLEGMHRTAFRALLGAHPPRKGDDGQVVPSDRFIGANMETLALPLARACLVGYKERPDADAPVLPIDDETVNWLLGFTEMVHDETTGDTRPVEHPPFATERQIDSLAAAALRLCAGDDAVPLSRRRSPTTPNSAAG
jgi:hypothetical protein